MVKEDHEDSFIEELKVPFFSELMRASLAVPDDVNCFKEEQHLDLTP